jgi:serine/threonine protein phosphatase PrpC
MIVEIFASTDVGRNYQHNEDNFAICRDLSLREWVFKSNEETTISGKGAVLLVADGMGGTNAGEVASDLAQQSVKRQFNALESIPSTDKDILSWLKKVILQAHEEIIAYQSSHLETAGMGTTLTVIWAFPQKSYVAWCGDSRLYIFRDTVSLTPVTDDHSYVWEMVRVGELTPEEARLHPESNIITQSLGTPNYPPTPDAKMFELQQGDRLLLCSDGLNSMLSDAQISSILSQEQGTMNTCKRLVEEANKAGGKDNITVIVLDVKEEVPAVKTVTVSQKLRKKNKVKNVIIGVMGVLLVTAVAFAMYNPYQEKRSKLVPQLSFVFALHAGKDTTIHASQLSQSAIDSMHISSLPKYGKINSSSNLSFVYQPASQSGSLLDSVTVFLFNARKQLSGVQVIFKLENGQSAVTKKGQTSVVAATQTANTTATNVASQAKGTDTGKVALATDTLRGKNIKAVKAEVIKETKGKPAPQVNDADTNMEEVADPEKKENTLPRDTTNQSNDN